MSRYEQERIPIQLLKEGATETKGKDARKNSFAAVKLITQVVRSSLGPRGMDKMLVGSTGDVTITNDGATISKDIDVEHPIAKMMVEIAKSVDNEAGDGTKSVVVLAGALIENSEELFNKDVHPTIIVEGFRAASKNAIEYLKKISVEIDPKDKVFLNKIAMTSMASKMVTTNSHILSGIVIDAALNVADEFERNKFKIVIDNIKVEKKTGGSLHDTRLVQGIIIDKEVAHAGMPKRIQGAKIVLLNSALEIEKTKSDSKLNISSPDQMQNFLNEEERMLKSMVDRISASGANVVLCQKGIDDIVQHYLAKEGIIAVRRIKESDMSKLSRATGARIVTNTDELSKDDIGLAELVEERKIETDKWVFIEGCKNPKAVTILIRGGSQRLVDEAERSIHDALMAVKCVVECPSVVVGGGSSEAIVSRKLREWSASLGSRQQITISPSSGSVLTSVDVTGTGFTPISVVTITFDGNFVDTVTTTSVGSFIANFNVPLGTSIGDHTVKAAQGSNSGSKTFKVTNLVNPIIFLDPASGPVGASVNITGAGFAPTNTVDISFNGSSVKTTNPDLKGVFFANFTVPQSSIGPVPVIATQGSDPSASKMRNIIRKNLNMRALNLSS